MNAPPTHSTHPRGAPLLQSWRHRTATLAIASTLALCLGCDSDPESAAGDAAVPPAEAAKSFAQLALFECMWAARCGDQLSALDCLDRSLRDDVFDATLLGAGSLYADRYVCLVEAADCAARDACLRGGEPPCVENVCDGDVAVECRDGSPTRVDCAALGAQCEAERPDGSAGCVADPPSSCVGDVWVRYEDRGSDRTFFVVADCAASGLACDAAAGCHDPALRGCQSSVCDGDKVINCRDGFALPYDCSDLHPDATCWDDAGQLRCGQAPADRACESSDDGTYVGAACQGDVLTLCVAGVLTTFDCAEVGARCAAGGAAPDCATPP